MLTTTTLAAFQATFQRIDDYTTRWEGPLTVSFPGRPDVPLTGRGFAATVDSAREKPGNPATVFGTSFNPFG